MSTTNSRTFKLRVASATWTPTYTVPTAPGQVVDIGPPAGNTGAGSFAASRPPSHSAYQWTYATMGYYGGGVFNPYYSRGGAWMVAGSGGHAAPPNHGCCLFDFEDATWKRIDHTHTGAPWRSTDYADAEIAGSLLNSGSQTILGSSPPVPIPQHLYNNQQILAPTNGGGSIKGSYLRIKGQSGGATSNHGDSNAYTFNLDTGQWEPYSTNAQTNWSNGHRTTAYDAATNRVYSIRYGPAGSNAIDYLDLNDRTFKTAVVSWPAGSSTFTFNESCWIDTSRHMLMMIGGSATMGVHLYGLNLSTHGAWTDLTVSGTITNTAQLWHYYPANGCFYSFRSARTGVTTGDYIDTAELLKLTPPAPNANPFAGTWTFSTQTLSSVLRNPVNPFTATGAQYDNRFFYVPALACFAWISGDGIAGDPVQLLLPAS